MIRRDGFGDILADGVKKAAERIGKGSEQFAMHAGGQELPMHDSRLDPGMQLRMNASRHRDAIRFHVIFTPVFLE